VSDERFTPGPWKAKLDHQYYWSVYSDSETYFRIASASDILPDRGEANARLMASAPDLLEALKAAKEVVDVAEGMTACRSDDAFIWSAQKLINAALAKATSPSTHDMGVVSHG
jgi:predicted GNAT family acetyltransferase